MCPHADVHPYRRIDEGSSDAFRSSLTWLTLRTMYRLAAVFAAVSAAVADEGKCKDYIKMVYPPESPVPTCAQLSPDGPTAGLA
eukprot:gene9930-8819_t